MSLPDFDALNVGDELPAVSMPPVTRANLAIYCGASGDHNPVHVDIDFARASGLDDVIAHGMLVMGYSGRVLSSWVPQERIKHFDTRFLAMTRIGDAITARARVIEKCADRSIRVEIGTANQHGEAKTAGTAVIDLA